MNSLLIIGAICYLITIFISCYFILKVLMSIIKVFKYVSEDDDGFLKELFLYLIMAVCWGIGYLCIKEYDKQVKEKEKIVNEKKEAENG